MPSALIIPGVQVKTEFEPSPALPGVTGVLGVVGVVDRGPLDPTSIGSFAELVEIFGPATRYTMPEVKAAFANGVSRAVIARVESRGNKASLLLRDDDGEKVLLLRARAEGAWGNGLAVKVTQVKTLSGEGVKYVNLEVSLEGKVVESFNGLVMDETSPDYLFARLDAESRTIVALDPLFEEQLPADIGTPNPVALKKEDPRAAQGMLKSGPSDVILASANKPGRGGNLAAVRVSEGQAFLLLKDATGAASLEILARSPGDAGTGITVTVSSPDPTKLSVLVTITSAGVVKTHGPHPDVAAIVKELVENDGSVTALSRGGALPAVTAAAVSLAARVTLEVITEGRDTAKYPNLADLDAIAGIKNDPMVTFSIVNGATLLPTSSQEVRLEGGRGQSPALFLDGDDATQGPLLELIPAQPGITDLNVSVQRSVAGSSVTLSVFRGVDLAETFSGLTMDPDDPNYLPAVLSGSSALLRAHDLFARSRTTSLPRDMGTPLKFTPVTSSPGVEGYEEALARLEMAEEVDLVIASVANQLTPADAVAVQMKVVAHCAKMGDVARNRIGLGSVAREEQDDVAAILDHADTVRSDHFILTAPAASEAAVAGLLARQDYFQSPTFKTVADGPSGRYSDSKLEKLITGNVLVVSRKRGLGDIVVKGLLTSGRQVNVQRTANKAVREVKAISDKYIGLLNNEGARNALQQQIAAMFLQMERDGAIVPSTDGKDKAFLVNVYSTQADFANGIVRIDIACRPVRAIDYIYATILVKN